MLSRFENTLADNFLHAPVLSPWAFENIDCRTLILQVLDLNPHHGWHAYTPGALSSIYKTVVSTKRMQSVKNKVRIPIVKVFCKTESRPPDHGCSRPKT